MKSIFDKLNLRPQERRLVVIVGIIVFVVVNFWFVRPHFGDLGRAQQQKRDAEKMLAKYKGELAKKEHYAREEKRLSEIGNFIPSEEQALELVREVHQQAQQSGVMIMRSDSSRGSVQRTNSFFEEQTLVIVVNAGEKELVDFLWSLGKGQSLTRVSSMSLQRDPSQTKLSGNLILVKSFQKKPPKAAAPVAVAAANPVRSPSSTTKAGGPPSTTKAAAPPSSTTKAAPPPKTPTNAPAANTNAVKRAGPNPAGKGK